jgi:RNA polymerase sigma factor (sigma-70 family)
MYLQAAPLAAPPSRQDSSQASPAKPFVRPTDEQLWQRVKAGEEAAMNELFGRHYDALYGYGHRLVRDEDLTKDAIQQMFVDFWHGRDRLADVRSVKPYLLVCLRRRLIKAGKAKLRFSLKLPKEHPFEVTFSHEDFLIGEQQSVEQAQRLAQALNQLPKRQREALYLKFFDDLPYEEMEPLLGIRYQSIRNLVHQALTFLRKEVLLVLFSLAPFV